VLPESWIAKIFSKLEGRYGSMFHDRWKGCDLNNVKATWAEELAPYAHRPEAIGHALKTLSGQKFPPTLPEFLEACRSAPEPYQPALPHKLAAEDHERAREAAEAMAKIVKPIRGDGIDAFWATHPRSALHLRFIFDAAARDQRFKPCVAEMVKDGICTADGHLLKTYRDQQWCPVVRRAA
jgi:hypothetical protein